MQQLQIRNKKKKIDKKKVIKYYTCNMLQCF